MTGDGAAGQGDRWAERLAAEARRWQGANGSPAGSRPVLRQHGQTCRQTAVGGERRGSKGNAEVLVSRSWLRGSALGRGGEGQAWAGVHVLC